MYSDQNVQTFYLDPKTYVQGTDANSQGRVNFELDGEKLAYLPNMRLLNVGVSSNGVHIYNRLLGAYAIIRNIQLRDGNTMLSELNFAQMYRGFLNVNHPNAKNESVKSHMGCNSLGWTIDGATRLVSRVERINDTTANEATTSLGYLDLREVFPMLNSVSHLPTAVFKNLNIQIEFETGLARQILRNITATIATVRPILACDVLENPAIVARLNSSLQSARWLEVEHDLFVIPTSALNGIGGAQNNVRQQVNVKLQGFNGKHLERLLICKEIADSTKEITGGVQTGFGRYSSQACYQQELQCRVNGRNVFPSNGIVGNNERTAFLIDSYGDFSAYPGFNKYGFANAANLVTDGAEYRGQLDYMGVYLGEYINDLQINYTRVGLQDATNLRPTTDQLNAHCYAEVAKQLVIRPDGSYIIQYSQN